jgi:FkbM family methyltransferase
VEEIALSNVNGEISLHIPQKEFSDLYSYISNSQEDVSNESHKVVNVKTIRLDDFIKQKDIEKIDLIKIDI